MAARSLGSVRPSGAHVRRHPRRQVAAWGAALAALLLAGGGAVRTFTDGQDEGDGCSGDPLVVAATPEIATTVESVLGELHAADPCATFEIRSVGSAQAAADISGGKAPDVWIPDSSTWVDVVDTRGKPGQWVEGLSIAKSPVVVAAGSTGKYRDLKVATWSDVVGGGGDLRMADPDADTASRLAFHASRIGQPDKIGLETGSRLIFMSRFAAPSVGKLLGDYLADPEDAPPFPASEQQVARLRTDSPDAPPLKAVMPAKGTLVLDYPWITNPTLTGADLQRSEKARAAFGTTRTRELLTEAGFRSSDGRGGPTIAGAKPAALTELTPLDRDERLAAVEQWDVLRTDMRMLAVVDVSSSMRKPSPTPGMSRWDVTQGALLKGAAIIPAGSQVGAWVFSTDKGGDGQDWKPVAPVRRLDASVGSGTHRDHLIKVVRGMGREVGGGTGLYDTVWAAYQEMQRGYDEDYVNSIVVFTDGKNADPNGGLSLQELLRKLDGAYDPKRPVRVITIGMGEADPGALQRIADESGGSSYIAETPDDIERVFVQALLARRA